MATEMTFAERRRQLAAACIGNVLEYYDFIVYAYLAGTIAHKFFPSDNEAAGLLASFAAFGVGFLARPLGGFVVGRIGDKRGRKAALLITIFGMALGTVGIGLLPTYETIGLMAPVLLVAMRLIQGLAAGGEWGGATAFIVESAPPGRRGLFGSIGQASIAASNLLGSVVVATIAGIFTADQMQDWAWRVPFLLGGLLLPVGVYMRRNLQETPAFVEAQQEAEGHDEHVADQQPVNGLAHHLGVLLDVEEEDHDELAREEHGGAGRDQPEGQLDEEDGGEVGLEEVHHAEGADEDAHAERPPRPEQRRHHAEVEHRLAHQQHHARHAANSVTPLPGRIAARGKNGKGGRKHNLGGCPA